MVMLAGCLRIGEAYLWCELDGNMTTTNAEGSRAIAVQRLIIG